MLIITLHFQKTFILTNVNSNASNYQKGIRNILSKLLDKSIQLQYSGQGKANKKNFSETELYKVVEGKNINRNYSIRR